jgi:hypothetical protein
LDAYRISYGLGALDIIAKKILHFREMSISLCGSQTYPDEPLSSRFEEEPNHSVHPARIVVGVKSDKVIFMSNVASIISRKSAIVPYHANNTLLISLVWRVKLVQFLRSQEQLIFISISKTTPVVFSGPH